MQKQWKIERASQEDIEKLAQELGISLVLAQLLWNRGLHDEKSARQFLHPEELQPEYDPFLMKDMEKAVSRILKAVESGEHITIYGDYDVDGMTSVAMLYTCLTSYGASVDFHIPDRFKEGYGFNLPALEEISKRSSLLISVDCGIASVKEVEAMRGRMDFVITDHHIPGKELPKALAVVNPHREDDLYPDKNLAGVGVAYKLRRALAQKMNQKEGEGEGLELAAIGTIADIVPLLGENRRLVRLGLSRIRHTSCPGLRALVNVAGLDPSEIGSEQVGFQLAPRLNAAGRMETAMSGARLLLTKNAEEAQQLASHLDGLNRKRQQVEQDILEKAEEELSRQDISSLPAIVLAGKGWHPGVIGIVASRLVEKYYKPVIILSITEEHPELAKGSCRSIEGLNMYEALASCREYLLGFGGHEMAAGLSLRTKDIESFRKAFCQTASETLTKDDYRPKAMIEFEMHPAKVTVDLVKEISKLEPYGCANPKPLFGCRNLHAAGVRTIGAEKQHLKFSIHLNGTSVDMLYWGQSSLAGLIDAEPLDIAYRPSINEWQGKLRVQAIVDSINPAEKSRIFPNREILVAIYRFLFAREKRGAPHADVCGLTQMFAKATGRRLSFYTMEQGLCVFRELGLLKQDADGGCALIHVHGRKLNLLDSDTFRRHQEKV